MNHQQRVVHILVISEHEYACGQPKKGGKKLSVSTKTSLHSSESFVMMNKKASPGVILFLVDIDKIFNIRYLKRQK